MGPKTPLCCPASPPTPRSICRGQFIPLTLAPKQVKSPNHPPPRCILKITRPIPPPPRMILPLQCKLILNAVYTYVQYTCHAGATYIEHNCQTTNKNGSLNGSSRIFLSFTGRQKLFKVIARFALWSWLQASSLIEDYQYGRTITYSASLMTHSASLMTHSASLNILLFHGFGIYFSKKFLICVSRVFCPSVAFREAQINIKDLEIYKQNYRDLETNLEIYQIFGNDTQQNVDRCTVCPSAS